MKKSGFLLLHLVLTSSLLAAEGKWTPRQILELDPAWLRQQGLQLAPEQLWDAKRGTGLLAAAIQVGGCSGGFVSPTGLIITNHHCLFGILQQHSSPENDIITKGYVARTRAEELPGKTIRATIPRRFVDVTAEVLAAVPPNATVAERAKAIAAKRKAIAAECEKTAGAICEVAVFDGGLFYTLIESFELADIRLVYAPPRAIGEYGGEIDNWMWPRHTGDFAIARAYANGEPYAPEFYFPIAEQGVREGDFVMLLGYPGVTYRSLIADEMEERRDLYFARREEVFGEHIRILEETTKGSAAGTIAMADHLKTLLNRYKNAQGQVAGFRRGRILEKQRAADDRVLAWAKEKPEYRDAVAAHQRLQQLVREQRATWERDFLFALIPVGVRSVPGAGASLPKSLYFGVTLARSSRERRKPEAQREIGFGEKDLPRVRQRLESDEKAYFAPADKAILLSWLRRARTLPADQRIAAVDRLFGRLSGDELAAEIDRMYAASRVFDLSERLKMFDESPEQLRARKDPILDLGFAIEEELAALDTLRQKWDGEIADARPRWRRAVIAHAGMPVSPDANRTLRVSLAHVKGYELRDAVVATPFTTLRGVVEKHTGEEPFDVPDFVLEVAKRDPVAMSVPVNFLADGDTTGGNSGSPVVNGRGELVGVNFDRVWENVANDFGYNPEVARNISADIGYMLWILRQTPGAEALLRELGAARVMGQKP